MDLIAALIVTGTIFTATTPEVLVPERHAQLDEQSLDQMSTGTLHHPDQKTWAQHRSGYELCTECVEIQPFPEGELPDE
ncbi:hypothetical protein [Ahrensia sp. R2A130]|uniref:hypothetical protein n=1 Tax=Ahrensia sp. R2A130 TaxID=744979 RepID=UPI0001E0D808|nr:hypothetical protein [Ahrensia sp. R2A130]EFL90328.1 conserved hypothetical protein [Ahrensia sp. R2A130]